MPETPVLNWFRRLGKLVPAPRLGKLVPDRKGMLVPPLWGILVAPDGDCRVPKARLLGAASPPVPDNAIQSVGLSGRFNFFLSVPFSDTTATVPRSDNVLLSIERQSAGWYR